MPQIIVSPHGKLYLEVDRNLSEYADLCDAFARGNGHGLLFLDIADAHITEEESFAYWKDFMRLYISLFAAIPNLEQHNFFKYPINIELQKDDLKRFLLTIPPMKGAEYVNEEYLLKLWKEVEEALIIEIKAFDKGIAAFFAARHSDLNLVGRVCFHLAENKNSNDTPFAFLATYAQQGGDGKSKHLPLNYALKEYSAAKQKNMLLRLLAPIHKASQESNFLQTYVDSGDIYHALAWTPAEAYKFLKDSPLFEKAGIVVKIPNWWKQKQLSKPTIKISIGEDEPVGIGFNALIDFDASLLLGDIKLNEKDIEELLLRNENLVFFKGQWVEVDKRKLEDLLHNWKKLNKQMNNDGITFAEGVRWLSGMDNANGSIDGSSESNFTRVTCGEWLEKTLKAIKNPETTRNIEELLCGHLHATLRHYQVQGVTWLHMLNQLKLGAILADDMGLGKTIQVISLLLLKKLHDAHSDKLASLLIVPASLIGNWKAEIDRFAPSLKYWVAHASENKGLKDDAFPSDDFDLCITTYGSVMRLERLTSHNWNLIIIDEAQAIKNPEAKQTKAIKALNGVHKLALTGTPIENRLSDLWSIFDFISPGLLGSIKSFSNFIKKNNKEDNTAYAALRSLVNPYILRRMKTDKKIISDLPDKTELKTYCTLSQAQVILYQQAVKSLQEEIANTEGIKRHSVIFSYLTRFKQICNHPSHWLKDRLFSAKESGKFTRLKEICEVIFEKQEKVLIFTQFKEMTGPLAEFLSGIFGRPGLVLHGGTDIKKRSAMVLAFQKEDGPPFFILSLKAGGSGLNLTAASHVIHFDRWWNPAVENQATDRAFRIGQKRNILVHKFICQGTLEEKIDMLIESKLQFSKEILEDTGSAMLTELSNDDLLKIVSLDIHSAKTKS